jgi:hypothetical protein
MMRVRFRSGEGKLGARKNTNRRVGIFRRSKPARPRIEVMGSQLGGARSTNLRPTGCALAISVVSMRIENTLINLDRRLDCCALLSRGTAGVARRRQTAKLH